ncbi:hypothetical protein [Streptosporangium sp. G12]
MSRRALANRLTALEAARPGTMTFTLDDGSTIRVSVLAVLDVFGESADWLRVESGDPPPADPPSRYLELLSRAVAASDDSMFAAGAVQFAQAAQAARAQQKLTILEGHLDEA